MQMIPAQMIVGLSSEGAASALAWWRGLTDAERSEVATICDARQEEWFFGLLGDSSAQAPRVIGGRFIPNDDDAGWSEWSAEYFDHLICHPELSTFEPPVVRNFVIGCTRHESARAVLATGRIPADFQCPLRSAECAVRRLLSLSPGQAFQVTSNCPASIE